MTTLDDLAALWRASMVEAGQTRVSVELQVGRPATGDDWTACAAHAIGGMAHHIVSSRSQGLTPGLRLCKAGRVDLPGPLCNTYGGFDEVARLITLGLANHPGLGDRPFPLSRGTVPTLSARYYLMGTEFEGGINEADWTLSFRAFMARVELGNLIFIAKLRGGGLRMDDHLEHHDWAPSRKIDRLNYSRARGVAEIRAAFNAAEDQKPPEEEDDMKAKQFSVVGDPSLATYMITDRAIMHVSDGTNQALQFRMGLLATPQATDSINLVQWEGVARPVLASGGVMACYNPACNVCLIKTRYKTWADASNDRKKINDLSSLVDSLDGDVDLPLG